MVDGLRGGPRRRGGFIPVQLGLVAEVKYYGRYKGGYPRRRDLVGRAFVAADGSELQKLLAVVMVMAAG